MKYIKSHKHSLLVAEIFFGVFLFLTILFIQIITRNDIDNSKLNLIRNNWEQHPILDIKDVDIDSDCPKDYEYLFEYEFPGTTSGCECGEFTLNSKGPCNFIQTIRGCINIPGTANFTTGAYKNRIICAKRSKDNYASLKPYIIAPDEKCKSKDCGAIDSLGNKLCTTSPCPINYLEFTKDLNDEVLKDKHKYIKLKHMLAPKFNQTELKYIDYYMLYDNKIGQVNGTIFTDIKISGGKGVCNSEGFSLYNTYGDCFFNNVTKVEDCSDYDTFYQHKDSVLGLQFYMNMDIFTTSYKNITSCTGRMKYMDKHIFMNTYHGMNLKCNADVLKGLEQYIFENKEYQIDIIPYFGLGMHITTVFYLLINLGLKWFYLSRQYVELKKVIIIEVFISIVLLGISILMFVQRFLIKEDYEKFKQFNDNLCGDAYVNDMTSELYNNFAAKNKNLWMAFIFILIAALVFPVKILSARHYKKKHSMYKRMSTAIEYRTLDQSGMTTDRIAS
jgi:hypothetical protein